MSSYGISARISRTTLSPPSPESNTPIGPLFVIDLVTGKVARKKGVKLPVHSIRRGARFVPHSVPQTPGLQRSPGESIPPRSSPVVALECVKMEILGNKLVRTDRPCALDKLQH